MYRYWIVYRRGSDERNQPEPDPAPVAHVEARDDAQAIAAAVALGVVTYHGQTLEARPARKCSWHDRHRARLANRTLGQEEADRSTD